MPGRTKTAVRSVFRTNLDCEISALPGRSWQSALGLFAHLENLSQRRGPDLQSVLRQLSRPRGRVLAGRGRRVEEAGERRVSYREVGRQVVRAAQAQVRNLQEKLERAQSLVLINEWAVAERLWSELVPECKTPLFEVSFLEELWGLNPDQFRDRRVDADAPMARICVDSGGV